MSRIIILLRRVTPQFAIDAAKRVRQRFRSARWKQKVESGESTRIGHAQLVIELRALGVQPGRDLIVHSALSKIGYVDGGPATVIAAIREVIGHNATLLMPCYPMQRNMLLTMQEAGPFDVLLDESTMGKITRIFRAMPGTLRSAHPTHSVAASGPAASEYTRHHHLSESPCGPGSPFAVLSANRGDILCLGSGIGKVTSHHTIEDQVTDFPVEVYAPEKMTKVVRFADGREQAVTVRVHNPDLAAGRVDNNPAKEREILQRMRDAGIVREGRVGDADCHLFGAFELDEMHRSGLKDGITIYSCQVK